jgi:hypothetical protein
MGQINLTKNLVVLVDDTDEVALKQWRWRAQEYRGKQYAIRTLWRDGRRIDISMHREILGLTDLAMEGDHKNGNGLDNRRENLRVVTHNQQNQNKAGYRNSKTGIRGISWDDTWRAKPWRARVKLNGKTIFNCNFENLADAKEAVRDARLKFMTHSVEERHSDATYA